MGLIKATVAGVAGLPGGPYKAPLVGSIPTTSTIERNQKRRQPQLDPRNNTRDWPQAIGPSAI